MESLKIHIRSCCIWPVKIEETTTSAKIIEGSIFPFEGFGTAECPSGS
jgi:hypothetical protein